MDRDRVGHWVDLGEVGPVSALRLTALATLVDSGDRWVSVAPVSGEHIDLHFNAPVPATLAALNGKHRAVRLTIEPADAFFNAPAAAPPRPAEEVAREMVSIERDHDRGTYYALIRDAAAEVEICLEDCSYEASARGSAKVAEGFIARAITRAREEGAAAERARQQSAHNPAVCQAAIDAIRSEPDGDARLAAELGYQASVEPAGPRREVMQLAADRLRSMAQPRDLAGRIREMAHAWVETWFTAEGDDATIVRVILEEFRSAYTNAYQGFSALGHVDFLRKRARIVGHESWIALYSRAADELEAIVRECAPETKP